MIGLASISTLEVDYISRLTLTNKIDYCNKWGYKFFCMNNYIPTEWFKRGIGFAKIRYLLQLLCENENLEFLFYFDIDTIITNFQFTLNDRVEVGQRKNIIISSDPHGVNCGVFCVKNTEWTRECLYQIWNRGPLNPNGNWLEVSEQNSLGQYLKKSDSANYCILSNGYFNSYFQHHTWGSQGAPVDKSIKAEVWEQGDFVIHFCGAGPQQKETLVKEYLGKVVK